MARCTLREHVGPLELRIRDARRAQRQCTACGRPVGRPLPLAEFVPAARRALPFWRQKRSARKGTARGRAYSAFLHSAVWAAQRLRILERDRYVCQGEDCGAPATTVHHKSYREVLADVPDSELVASCTRCNVAEREHRIANQGGNQWRGVTRPRPT